MVAVHLPKERRNWKFDMRWDVGIYAGQPEHSVKASLVFFPYKNQMLVRTDVAKMDMTAEDYKRFYFKRYNMTENSSSTATRLSHRIDEWVYNFSLPPTEENNDEEPPTPLTAPLAEPEETPEEVQIDPVHKRRRTWEQLPANRVTRAMSRRAESTLEPHQTQAIVHGFSAAVKAFVTRSSGPDVRQALDSVLRDQWIIAMADEIIENMMNATQTLVPEDIDESKAYKLIHTTMQLKIKMKTDTIVDKLKARLCACGNEPDEVDHETYSPTVSSLKHSSCFKWPCAIECTSG